MSLITDHLAAMRDKLRIQQQLHARRSFFGASFPGVLLRLLAATLILRSCGGQYSSKWHQRRVSGYLRRLTAPQLKNPGVRPGFRHLNDVRNVSGPILDVGRAGAGTAPRRLVLVPQCGLGDRLMVLSRAHDLSLRMTGGQVYFNWYPGNGVNLAFDKGFDTSSVPPPFEFSSLRQRNDLGVYGSCLPAEHCKQKIRTLFPNSARDEYLQPRCWLQAHQGGRGRRPPGYLRHEVSVVLECRNGDGSLFTMLENRPHFSNALHNLAPSPAVAQTIRQVEEELGLGPSGGIAGAGARRVGIHFRGTDKLDCFSDIRRTILWRAFVRLVQRATRRVTADTVFFVATNDPEVVSRLQAELPASTVLRTRAHVIRSRENEAGMLDAVVDWFLLAGSQFIIGNVESSFAYSASVRNGIRYSVAFGDTRLCNM